MMTAWYICPRLKRKKEVTQTVLDIKDFPKGGDASKFLYAQAKHALIIHMRLHGGCIVERGTMFFEFLS